MSAYLQQLTIRLADGIGRLPEATRVIHTQYLLKAQRPDGGFAGRMGDSDLYYTAFGLRGLSILGELYGEPAQRAANFLSVEIRRRQSMVDFFSLFYAANLLHASAGLDILADQELTWPNRVVDLLNSLRRDDGGFSKGPEGVAGSTYNTFLIMLVFQLMGREIPDPNGIVRFLNQQLDPAGGWREIRVSKRAGTNPTAAAVGAYQIMGHSPDPWLEPTIDFLCDMQTDEGGLRANTRIPIADLLSSFTGAWSLQDLNALDEVDMIAYERFVNSLQLPSGGFRAAEWDETHDVEYTFYGMGCLALIESWRQDRNQTQ